MYNPIMPQRLSMSRYPWWLPMRLATRIESCQTHAAHDDLERVLARFDREHDRALAPRKLRCAALMSVCLRGAHRGGAASEAILDRFMHGLDELAGIRSWPGVCTFMQQYIDDMLAEVRPHQTGEVEQLVRAIRKALIQSPDRVRSLKQYAKNAGLNADYVSRKYIELTGESFREERRQLQMDRARELLTGTSMKISVIAKQVGINDCSCFIQSFKSWSGATPAQYRRTHRRSQEL